MHARTSAALAAIERYPFLHAQIAPSLRATQQHIERQLGRAIPRPDIIDHIQQAVGSVSAAIVTIEGNPATGVTSLLCQLAASYPSTIWLPSHDAGQGLALLCAQLIAHYQLPISLLAPNSSRDTLAFEQVLAEAARRHTGSMPLLIVADDCTATHTALQPLFAPSLPAGVVLVLGSRPDTANPLRSVARIRLPETGAAIHDQLTQVGLQAGIAPAYAPIVADYAQGAFVYPALAARLLAAQLVDPTSLPVGLTALYQTWWQSLTPQTQLLVQLVAAAGEPIDLAMLATLADCSVAQVHQALASQHALIIHEAEQVTLAERSAYEYIAQATTDQLQSMHARYAKLLHAQAASATLAGYGIRQIARHTALSDSQTQLELLPHLTARSWTFTQERRTNAMQQPAYDAAWILSIQPIQTPARRMPALIELVRSAALTSTLTLLARSMAVDAPSKALEAALQQGISRDLAVRRIRAMIDQLPNGRDKAQVLRRLGDTCYTHGLRGAAMRMLSEALDLEHPGLPRAWVAEREETLVALARAAIANGTPDLALGITTLIAHPERRGLIDTEVVRQLISRAELTRAEEVAYAISHASTHEWAMAEVAVGWARTSDRARADDVLATLRTNTAIAWVKTELACDAARAGDAQAASIVRSLATPALRNRATAQLVRALVLGGQPEAAFQATITISDPEIRARALVGMAETEPQIAEKALSEAEYAIGPISIEDSPSVRAAIAAAWAACGLLDRALQIAAILPPGEEHDRAQARIAVALAQRGNDLEAHNVTFGIPDDDERAWALNELARQLAQEARWPEAFALATQIGDTEQRARTEADLAIAWARGGDPAAAHMHADQIAHAGERIRALCAIAAPLVAAGHSNQIRAAAARTANLDLRSRYQSAAVQAMASVGELGTATPLANQIARPIEQARALNAIARAAAKQDYEQSIAALAAALRHVAQLGRSETLACIAAAADTFLIVGGAELLLSIASMLDEIDGWWR